MAEDPETELGYAEGSSLLSGRLAGGESPPPHSPALSTGTLGPARRPGTPLSTRRFPYNPVGAGFVASREGIATPPLEPARPSTEDVHRRSEADRLVAGPRVATAPLTIPEETPAVMLNSPTATASTPTTRRTSGRFSPSRVGATAAGVLGFLGLRRSHPSTHTLGAGWEQVTPPHSFEGLAASTGLREPERTASSRETIEAGPLAVQRGLSQGKSRSTLSGHSAYFDAPSRPGTPPIPGPSVGGASGWGTAAGAGALGSAAGATIAGREMSQKDQGLVTQRSTPRLRPQPPQMNSPSTHSLPMTSAAASPANPFESPSFVITQPPSGQPARRDPFEDALDSPVPVGLLPPGLEQNRGMWSREAILEEDDVANERGALLGGRLDDAPPAPARSLAGNGNRSGSHLTLAAMAGRSRDSVPASMRRADSPFSIQTGDSETGRPWSGQVSEVSFFPAPNNMWRLTK